METAGHIHASHSVMDHSFSIAIILMVVVVVVLAWRYRRDISHFNARLPMILLLLGMTGIACEQVFHLFTGISGDPAVPAETYASYYSVHQWAEMSAIGFICIAGILLAVRFAQQSRRLEETSEERDKATRNLSNRRDEFTRAVELSNIGIWHWNVADDRVFFSDKLQEMLGADPANPITRIQQWEKLVDTYDAAHQRNIAAAFRAGEHNGEYVTEYTAKQPNGEERYFITRAGPWYDETGTLKGLTGADIDVTEIKQLTKDLLIAKEEAEAANKMKSTFLANISHELRTPLNAIIGFSEVLDSQMFGPIGDERYKEYASIIRSSGGHLLEIINDLLDVARIEAGEAIVDQRNVNVGDMINQVLHALSEGAARKGISLKKNIVAPIRYAYADPRHVRQMTTNLVSNAIKFTDRGGSVTVSADSLEDDVVAISVTDTGIGIPKDQLDRVMQPFQQVAQSYTRDHEGTGLGLPITRSLARLNGGEFEISSIPGAGTEVTLSLPASPDGQICENETTDPNPVSEETQTRDAS